MKWLTNCGKKQADKDIEDLCRYSLTRRIIIGKPQPGEGTFESPVTGELVPYATFEELIACDMVGLYDV